MGVTVMRFWLYSTLLYPIEFFRADESRRLEYAWLEDLNFRSVFAFMAYFAALVLVSMLVGAFVAWSNGHVLAGTRMALIGLGAYCGVGIAFAVMSIVYTLAYMLVTSTMHGD